MGLFRCLSLPVFTVIILILSIHHIVMFLVIDPWLGFDTAPGVLNAFFFTSWTVLGFLAYILAIIRVPGSIPPLYSPDVENSDAVLQEVKRKGGVLRYCQKCSIYKPPRAHHCRVCKRCVLRMDHHCVWINNCVGQRNYKHFFLFVSYTVVALAHALVLLSGQFIYDLGGGEEGELEGQKRRQSELMFFAISPTIAPLLKGICFVTVILLLVALGVLLIWHIYLTLSNKTTIEYYEGVRAKWLAKKAGEAYRHPYDLGIVNNLLVILGPNIVCWGCPPAIGHIGDGLRFETAYDQPKERATGVGEGVVVSRHLWLTRRTRLPC